jgi:O-antigen/teichoic acid export membrane protein
VAGAEETEAPPATGVRAIDTRGLSLRAFAAKGLIVNSSFDVGLSLLGLLRGFILAALLTRDAYGIWGILGVTLGVLSKLKLVGISDKFLQQNEPDQELAFQKAFTLEVLVSLAGAVPLILALPVAAVIYHQWALIAPGLVLVSALIADALQAPFWIFYRDMDFVKQRVMGLLEPIVGFVVAIVLAALGAGYWALAIGLVAGAWSGALLAVATSRYPLRWRYDKGALKVYGSFSAPIFIATLSSIVLANSSAIVANAHLGLAAVGAIALAATITSFTTKIDDLVGGTLYPAVCAVQDRLDLLRESFVKTNRLALMWAVPFGVGLALFAADLVQFGIGEKWHSAIIILQVNGLVAGIGHIAWNYDDYLRARANTRPIAVVGVAAAVTFLAVGIPLLLVDGLAGFAIGLAAQALVAVALRAWYMTKLFEGFVFIRHACRAILPTVPAAAAVLLMRQLETGPRTFAIAIAELVVYSLVTVLATCLFERDLIREAFGYMAARAAAAPS